MLLIAKIEMTVRTLAAAILTYITLQEGVEITVKIITGLCALFVAYLQWLSYKSRKRVEDLQVKKENEKLG
jgi:hypothetical protein